jgi:Protein of unknown function (DUF1588)/Protein of unknown function (DUF1592)/Protein of unknown function (DUF1595)/Protein of unknown function (DUF1585)/Protein of unknown function (DUF1587)
MRALNELRCSAPHFVALAGACCLAASLAACEGGSTTNHGVNGTAGGAQTGGGTANGTGGGSGLPGPVGPGNLSTASASVARRLSRVELSNVVRDVLGDDSGAANKFLSEDVYRPFDNDYTVQHASGALIESLEALATDIADRAMLPANRAKIVTCTPTGPGDAACLRTTIETIGRRLYRRPLSEQQITAYLSLQSYATENTPGVAHDFYTAVDLVLRSMLQDPEVLYRVETGTPSGEAGIYKLDSYEVASRLSFLLWGSGPDDALLDQAKAGSLLDGASRIAAATGLLADTRARQQLERFHSMWLGYRAIPAAADLATAFSMESNKLIEKVVFDQPSSYLDLFTSSQTYVNSLLATQYGLPAPAGGEGWVSYVDDKRAGILSHGSVLAAFSKFSDTSPTQRGIFIQTRLLCNKVQPPPANVNVDQPPTDGDKVCKIDRYDAHRALASCAACHSQLDPIGYGLENYDIGGKYRTHDDAHAECILPDKGSLPGFGDFSGPGQLAHLLVDAGKVEQCFMQHLMTFAIGRELRPEEDSAKQALLASFKSGGYNLQQLLTGYAKDDRFALRQEEVLP